ncbi:MAG: transporter substrate-binding domain-containing protein [Candidatus Riflebacteria bacterium]|nr:transporter substrate-binding domain-containing protein [Candidatus Riflebacteria bacterium]
MQKVELSKSEREFLDKHPLITLGTEKTWEPFVIVKDNGDITGYDSEILGKINEATGANFQLRAGKWLEMQEKARRKEIDGLSTGAIHEERKVFLNFSNIYASLKKTILVQNGNPKNIFSKKDLKGKKIIIHKGNLLDEKLALDFKESTILSSDSIEGVIKAVISGEADAAFGNGSILYASYKLNLPYIQIAFPLEDTLSVAFGIRKDWPEAISILNKGLAEISGEERLRIQNRWFFPLKSDEDKLGTINFTPEEQKYLAEKEVIDMCTDPNWMPYSYIDDNDLHKGMLADYLDIIAKRIGRQIKLLKTKSWSESLEFAKSKQCDILSAAVPTPSRREYLNFTQPLIDVPMVIATTQDQVFIESIHQVMNSKFAITKNYPAIEILRKKYPDLKIVEVNDALSGLRMVEKREVLGYIGTISAIGYLIQRYNLFNLKIAGKLEERYKISVGIRNDDPLLLSIINKAIDSITEKERAKILSQWISVKYERGFDYNLFWKIIGGIIAVLSVGIYLFTIVSKYNQKLEQINQKLEETVIKLQKAISQVKKLSGLLPICSHCKKIKDDKGYWNQIESYVREHSDAEFTHGICEECAKKYYPEYDLSED